MSVDAARKQRRKAAARNMKKRNLQSAAEARAVTEEDVVGEAPAGEDRAMGRLSAAVEEASTGGEIMQAARRLLVETMQVGSMEEARQHAAEAASVLGWGRAGAAQEVLYVQGVEESMLGAMAEAQRLRQQRHRS